MKSEQLKDDFYPSMKVSLGDDYGVVTDEYRRISDTYSGQDANADLLTMMAHSKVTWKVISGLARNCVITVTRFESERI